MALMQDPPEQQAAPMGDHERQMIELHDQTNGITQQGETNNDGDSVKPDGDSADTSDGGDAGRPEWLPEKFKSAEDLAKAYSELEKKLGAGKPKSEGDVQEGEGDQEGAEKEVEDQSEDKEDKKPKADFEKFTQEFAEKGDLSEDSRKELNDIGIPDGVIDTYLDNLREQQSSSSSELYEAAGGEESYSKLIEWAGSNLDQGTQDSYNSALERGDVNTAKTILAMAKSKYDKAMGSEGSRIKGSPEASSGDVFTDWAQVQEVMNDPRYRPGSKQDQSFVREVTQKLNRSPL